MADKISKTARKSKKPEIELFSLDESGYTGFDLTDPDQRFQGGAAVSIPEEEAKRLIKEHFPRLQADELKFSSLVRRATNRRPLLNLQRDVLAHFNVTTYVCDKRYLLTLMFLDNATEPFYYERGIDFYKDGQNYSMASLIYTIGPAMLGEGKFFEILSAFQTAVREKNPYTLQDLVRKVRESNWETTLAEAFGPLATASPECLRSITEASTDAALVVVQSLLNRIEATTTGPYRVEHDRSKNLLDYSEFMQRLIDNKEEIEFKQTQIATLKFPLRLRSATQVDSKDRAAVQIADVLVGAALRATNVLTGLRPAEGEPLETFKLYRDDQFIHMIPSLDFDGQKKFRKGTQAGAAIDYFAKMLQKN